jgi:general secretion pathway protein A
VTRNPLDDCYQFLGFKSAPFSLTPDTTLFFPGSQHVAAFNQISHACAHGMLVVMTGEVGMGKTLVIRKVMRSLPEEVTVAYLLNPLLEHGELLREIYNRFCDAPAPSGMSLSEVHAALLQQVLVGTALGRHFVVIVDEAHRLQPESLEMLRLLSNLETERQKLIGLVLVGQPELERTLLLNAMRPLRERIGVWLKLSPMCRQDMGDYIRHRIRLTHREGRFEFSDLALWQLHRRSKGVPRRINFACEKALLLAYARGQQRVGWNLARQACLEFSKVWS